MSNPELSFKEAYAILRDNSARLSKNQEIDIDELVPLVTASTEAYRICKQRLDAVEAALQAAFKESDEATNLPQPE